MNGKMDVGFVFLTADHCDRADSIIERLWLELDLQCLTGCSAEGVIGGDREIERSPGLTLLVGGAAGRAPPSFPHRRAERPGATSWKTSRY